MAGTVSAVSCRDHVLTVPVAQVPIGGFESERAAITAVQDLRFAPMVYRCPENGQVLTVEFPFARLPIAGARVAPQRKRHEAKRQAEHRCRSL